MRVGRWKNWNSQKWFVLGLYVLFTICMIFVLKNKEIYNVDEIYTYGLSNNIGNMDMEFEQGVKYSPAVRPYMEYMCVEEGEAFSYGNVWENQKKDVHPPLYYAVLHTICSFFPGQFVEWSGALLNILFGLLTLYYVRKIVMLLTEDNLICNMVSLLFCVSPGIWNVIVFIRMYTMAMFCVTLFTYLIFLEIKDVSEVLNLRLIAVAVMSALTHYYCIVYMFFVCLVYGIWLLRKKSYKTMAMLCGSMAIGGGISLVIFHDMIRQMLVGQRGEESVDNLLSSAIMTYLQNMKDYAVYINNEVFGRLLPIIVLLLILFVGYMVTGKKKHIEQGQKLLENIVFVRYMVVLLATLGYYLLVCKMSVSNVNKYMFPIYGVLIAVAVGLFFHMLSRYLEGKTRYIAMGILGTILFIASVIQINPRQLLIEPLEIETKTRQYAEVDCLYIYDTGWKTMASYDEIPNYNSVTFVSYDNLDMLSELDLKNEESLMLMISCEGEEHLKAKEKVMESYGALTKSEEVGSHYYTRTYYLSGDL